MTGEETIDSAEFAEGDSLCVAEGGCPRNPAWTVENTRVDAPPRPPFHQQAALEGVQEAGAGRGGIDESARCRPNGCCEHIS